MFPCRPDHHFLEAICCFPMVYFMVGSIDKYVCLNLYYYYLLSFNNIIATITICVEALVEASVVIGSAVVALVI